MNSALYKNLYLPLKTIKIYSIMSMKKSLVLVLIIISNIIFAQQSLNEYKYVIVPKKYDFLQFDDQYQLNSLTKFLFKKEGFKTLFDSDSKSQELANNSCLGLITKVKNNSGVFSTKLVIELVNCKNEIIHTSNEGRSKQKDYKKAYQEALRNAFKSITSLNYRYTPTNKTVTSRKKEVLIEENPTEIVKKEIPVTVETAVEEVPIEVVEEVIPLVEEVALPNQKIKEAEKEVTQDVPFTIIEKATNLLYAQTNPLGFQLVDSTPKVMYILLKSSTKDLYFLKNKNGIVFKQDNKWFAEFYNENKLIKHELHIKF